MGASSLRRSRGYFFEHWLVEKFKSLPGWDARRLGGSSTGLPDVVATHYDGILFVIECKSTYSNEVYIPPDQVQRCVTTKDFLGYYDHKHIIYAVKFARHSVKEGGKYKKKREPKMYFFEGVSCPGGWALNSDCGTVKITYDGRMHELYPDSSPHRNRYDIQEDRKRVYGKTQVKMPWMDDYSLEDSKDDD